MDEYIYGRYISYDDRRCHDCGMYLKDHDWIGCPDGEVSGEEALLELR